MKKLLGAIIGLLLLAGCGAPASPADPPASSAPPATVLPETFAMPELVGKNLQKAQDELQSLGSYLLDQKDASGAGRLQLDDSNWQVCEQEPAAGQEVPITATVVLSAVKNDENCSGDEPPAEPTVKMTTSQKQAVRKAEDYLDLTAFSRKGLIKQLKFEGFSNKDATFAVDHIDVDWNEQAALKAQAYLDLSSFSRKSLIKQLEFEGFTSKQAEYGAKAVGL